MRLNAVGLDLLAALASAKAVVAATLGKESVAIVLGSAEGGTAEVIDPDDLPIGVSDALRGPSGRWVFSALLRSAQPVRVSTDALPDEASELRVVLQRHAVAALAAFPLIGERGVIGYMATPYSEGEGLPAGEDEAWRLACRAIQGTQLLAASAALRAGLAHDRRRPAQLFDGLLVLDGRDRVVLPNGLFEVLPGWTGTGPVGRPLATLPGGDVLTSLEESDASRLVWSEHLVPVADGEQPMALASLPLARVDGAVEGGRIVFARDLRTHSPQRLDGTGRMLALAMRVSHIADHISHAIRVGRSGRAGMSAWIVEGWSREIAEASRLVGAALEKCLPGEDQSSLEVNDLLEEVLARYGSELEPEGVKLLTSFRPDLPVVPGDRLSLLRAVRILVQEARESLRPGGGVLTVRSWADDTWVYASISDDGATDTSATSQLPEPIFRRRAEAHQAGVEAVREIVERYGGRLLVERRPTVWNRITIMLRKERRSRRRERPTAQVVSAHAATNGDREGLCVLVVDDNAALRSVLRRYLERRGHDVTEAMDGVEGLRLVQSREFDRLIVDIQMPNKDGPEFYEELSGVDPTMQSRTIFVTGGFLTETVERFIRESGRPSVKKPFDLAEMARTVEA